MMLKSPTLYKMLQDNAKKRICTMRDLTDSGEGLCWVIVTLLTTRVRYQLSEWLFILDLELVLCVFR
jgi:hypothetical protein